MFLKNLFSWIGFKKYFLNVFELLIHAWFLLFDYLWNINAEIDCREKLALFTELADIFNDSENQKLWRDLLNRVSS